MNIVMSESGPVIMVDIKEPESIELIKQFIENIKKQNTKDPHEEAKSKVSAKQLVDYIYEMVSLIHNPIQGMRSPEILTPEQIIEQVNSKFLIIRR